MHTVVLQIKHTVTRQAREEGTVVTVAAAVAQLMGCIITNNIPYKDVTKSNAYRYISPYHVTSFVFMENRLDCSFGPSAPCVSSPVHHHRISQNFDVQKERAYRSENTVLTVEGTLASPAPHAPTVQCI